MTLLLLNNPSRTAEEYTMLDVLSNGRLDIGIGRGVLKAEYELFDINESESQGRFHESLGIILQVWTLGAQNAASSELNAPKPTLASRTRSLRSTSAAFRTRKR